MTNSTIKRYNRNAQKYEKKWKKYLNHTHAALLERIDINHTDKILDASGGTGLLVRQILKQGYSFDEFCINDPSKQMLAIARRRFSDHENIRFSNDKVQQLSHPANYFDTVICLNAFHFYDEQQQVLNQFYKILKPGGKLYILDWNHDGFFRIVNQFIKWTSSEYIATRSLGELQKMVRQSGFELSTSDSWNWRYWQFLFLKAYKA